MTTIQRGDYVWPASDRDCYRAVITTTDDLDFAMGLVPEKRVAIQAGGNAGIWPALMGKVLHTVYTFEPDPINYACLVQNVPANVIPRMAALGDEPDHVGLVVDPKNIGAHYIAGHGPIEVVTIDSLALTICDMIVLDVEGYELKALKGAAETLTRCRPLVHIEDKGLSEKYGSLQGDAEKWLAGLGYSVTARRRRDVILTCATA